MKSCLLSIYLANCASVVVINNDGSNAIDIRNTTVDWTCDVKIVNFLSPCLLHLQSCHTEIIFSIKYLEISKYI